MKTRLFALIVVLLLSGCSSDDGPTGPERLDLNEIFPESEAVITDDGSVINLRMIAVRFDLNTANLTAESKPVLDKFADVFAQYPDATYSVETHSASPGSASYNESLTQEQARTVKDYFIDELNGNASDINAIGYGETRPIESNDTREGRAANRRVEVIIHQE